MDMSFSLLPIHRSSYLACAQSLRILNRIIEKIILNRDMRPLHYALGLGLGYLEKTPLQHLPPQLYDYDTPHD